MPIARVTQGKDAYLCLNYVLTKDQAELLETNCATEQPATIAQEFKRAFEPHLRKGPHWHTRQHVAHFSIGFHAAQAQETLIAVAHRFMDLMGFDPSLNQYVLAQHHDTDDCHIHLVANRIRLDGTVVSDSFSKRRAEVAMRTIEAEFGFPPLKCSWDVDIKAPTVAEVRRSRKTGEPIPRQELQAIVERTVSGCRTLEALQTALQAEGVTLVLTPIATDAVPQRTRRKGRSKGKEEADTTSAMATGNGTPLAVVGEGAGDETSPTDTAQPAAAGRNEGSSGMETTTVRYPLPPVPAATPTEQTPTPAPIQPPTRYQLVYQWTPPNGKVQTFSASALGNRYTQRGLQVRWGVGLEGSALIDWAVQQTATKLFAAPLNNVTVTPTLPSPPLEAGVAAVETVTAQLPTGALPVNAPSQDKPATLNSTSVSAAPAPVTAAPPVEASTTAHRTPSQQEAWQYYQSAWLKLEQAYIQSTGLTRESDPQFDVQVLRTAWERWSVEQCVAMVATTAAGQYHSHQGRAAFTAYVQQLFDQVTDRRRVKEPVALDM